MRNSKIDQYYASIRVVDGSSGTLVSGNIKLCGYSQGFSRKETSNDSGVARHAHVLRSHAAEVYSLCA